MRVLARPVGRDHTGIQAGVKAVVLEPVPCFRWSKGAVHFRGGRDAPRIALEQHRSPQMTKECFKMHFSRNSLLTFAIRKTTTQVAKLQDFFALGIKWILRDFYAPIGFAFIAFVVSCFGFWAYCSSMSFLPC